MKVKKKFNVVLSAIFMMGLGMGIASCSDDNKNMSDNPGSGDDNKTEAQYEQQQLGWDIITQLSDERTAPADWENKTFEPTIGVAKDDDPYTRIVMTNDVATAATRYGDLVGLEIDESTAGYQFSLDGIGSLNYQRGSENDQYLAQVSVDIKQMPHLKKILYQTEKQAGLNASLTGTAYYRFGDVVQDEFGSYWICVRPSFSLEGKGDSHWMSTSFPLPEENIYHYKGSNGTDYYLPTGLGKSTEHMQNMVEMLYAMLYPTEWMDILMSSPKLPMFHDFSTKRMKYHNIYFWQRVDKAWQEQDFYDKFFNRVRDKIKNIMNSKGVYIVYRGYTWPYGSGWNGGVYCAHYRNGDGAKINNMHSVEYSTEKKDLQNLDLDFRTHFDSRIFSEPYGENIRFLVRYKTGKQLSKNKVYNPKTSINGCKDIYVYNKYYYKDAPNGIYDLNSEPEETPKPE
jgi:hypothetical protein